MSFPKIKNMRWLSEDYPDLIVVKVVMEDRAQAEAGLLAPEEILIDFYLDLSKLSGVRDWYPKGCDTTPSKTESLCDFEGISQMVLYITKEQLLAAWKVYKEFINGKR